MYPPMLSSKSRTPFKKIVERISATSMSRKRTRDSEDSLPEVRFGGFSDAMFDDFEAFCKLCKEPITNQKNHLLLHCKAVDGPIRKQIRSARGKKFIDRCAEILAQVKPGGPGAL